MHHEPVMVEEVMNALQPKVGDVVVDGTVGLGGHADRILAAISPMGSLYGFDWDRSMLDAADAKLREKYGNFFHGVHADYRDIPAELESRAIRAAGILLDLGLNNAQIEDPSRGISFKTEGPLDMRMDRSRGEPAAAMLNRLSPTEIEKILWNFGDERWAKAIARQITERRRSSPLRTTQDLVDAVLAAVPSGARETRIHPATRTFQAVRIAVNRELEDLQEALEQIAERLEIGGTFVVLSYHSGEDRAVKNAFRSLVASGNYQDLYKKPLLPTSGEVARNSKSRSAKLRAIRRTTN